MMKRRYYLKVGLMGLFLIVSIRAFADAPVIDFAAVTNLIKSYKQLKTQYDLLHQTYQNAQQQLDRAKALVNDNEGHYGFGGLKDSASDFKNRQWSPSSWKQTLQGLSGGNSARYQELVSLYKRDHPTLPTAEYEKGASKERATAYEQSVEVNRAAVVNSTYAFDNIKTHLDTLHALTQKIDTAPNTKAAMDLNSRIVAESAYIQAQELKMQIVTNQQLAQTSAEGLASKTASAKFNTIPDE